MNPYIVSLRQGIVWIFVIIKRGIQIYQTTVTDLGRMFIYVWRWMYARVNWGYSSVTRK